MRVRHSDFLLLFAQMLSMVWYHCLNVAPPLCLSHWACTVRGSGPGRKKFIFYLKSRQKRSWICVLLVSDGCSVECLCEGKAKRKTRPKWYMMIERERQNEEAAWITKAQPSCSETKTCAHRVHLTACIETLNTNSCLPRNKIHHQNHK